MGMAGLKSAWGALLGFHASLLPLVIINWRTVVPKLSAPIPNILLIPVAISGALAGIGLLMIWPYAGIRDEFSSRVSALGLSGAIWLPFIIYFTLINPWLEEAYWRGTFSTPSRYPALIDLLFAGYHLIILSLFVNGLWMAIAFVILALAGWGWRQVSRYTGSLLPAVLAHSVADFSILLVMYHFAG